MAIKSGQSTAVIGVGTGDTTLITSAVGSSSEMYSGVLNHTGTPTTDITVEIFLSSDATSAAGERIDIITLADGELHVLMPVVIPPTYYLLAKGDTTGVNFNGIYTKRTGTDV